MPETADLLCVQGLVDTRGSCWPGKSLISNGTLHITTLRVGPAVIRGGFVGIEASWGVAVDRLVVEAGSTTTMAFVTAGSFVTFQTIEVSRLWFF